MKGRKNSEKDEHADLRMRHMNSGINLTIGIFALSGGQFAGGKQDFV